MEQKLSKAEKLMQVLDRGSSEQPEFRPPIPKIYEPLWQPSRYKAFYGGRGGGKTETIARRLIELGMEEKHLILGGREIYNSIEDSSKAVLDDILDEYDLWGEWESLKTTIVNHRTGTRFIFRGLQKATIKSIKSLKGVTIFWGDEADAFSERSLQVLLPTIRAGGSELWFSWNPNEEDDPIHKMFVGGEPPPDSIVVFVNWWDNPFFPQELKDHQQWMKVRDPELEAHIYGGQTRKQTKEQIYSNWREEAFEAPDGVVFYFGADWGFSIDPSCLVRCWLEPGNRNKLYIDYEAWALGCPIEKLHQLFDPVPHSHDFPITADSSKPETIAYLKKRLEKRDDKGDILRNELNEIQYWNRYQMRPSKKGPGSVIEGIEFLQALDIVVHPRCKHVIEELKGYKFKVDPHTSEILRVPVDKKNHLMDSLRYAVERVRRMSGLPGMPTVVPMG